MEVFIVFLVQGVAVGLLCSYVATEKNRDGGSWFILGLLFSVFAFLALIAVPATEAAPSEVVPKKAFEIPNDCCQACGWPNPDTATECRQCGAVITTNARTIEEHDQLGIDTSVAPTASNLTDLVGQIERLDELHRTGVLSGPEFVSAKAKLLS
jgi:ribosomal protein L40E